MSIINDAFRECSFASANARHRRHWIVDGKVNQHKDTIIDFCCLDGLKTQGFRRGPSIQGCRNTLWWQWQITTPEVLWRGLKLPGYGADAHMTETKQEKSSYGVICWCLYLCLTLAQKWPGCHWWWCSSSVGLWTGAGTPGCQSSPPQPRWAWFPRSSGRSAAVWAPDLGCCHTEWVEYPVMSSAGPQLVTCRRGEVRTSVLCHDCILPCYLHLLLSHQWS